MSFEGKLAVVAGGGGGIGLRVAYGDSHLPADAIRKRFAVYREQTAPHL